MHIGKSKSSGMGRRRDFGLNGVNGKGSQTRTNLASRAWQENYDQIFRRRKVAPSKRLTVAMLEGVARAVSRQDAQPPNIL